MDILTLIKKRASIRKYKPKKIPCKKIKLIIEAGIWGPSIHHFQPWKFIVVEKKYIINKIAKIVLKKFKKINVPSFIFYPTITVLTNAQLMICVYNTKKLTKYLKKYNKIYFKKVGLVEISAISASIQNMILTAESLGIGSCWLDMPLLCSKEINNLLNMEEELAAVITFGYPNQKGIRSHRSPIYETVKYIK